MHKSLIAIGIMMLIPLLGACSPGASRPIVANTQVALLPSASPFPTHPPTSTLIPSPTATPTSTPTPSPTLEPTATPVPTSPPTETPAPTEVVPPTRVPQRFFVAERIRDYTGSGPGSNQQQSAVAGRVVDSRGNGIANALLYLNNSASTSQLYPTNGNGEFYIPQLGASSWSLVLTYVPGAKIARQTVQQFYVNGDPGQEVIINFLEQWR